MTGPIVINFPGASLMEITSDAEGLRVRCPGCRQVKHLPMAPGAMETATFEHEDGCPIHARIRRAMRRYERDVVRRG